MLKSPYADILAQRDKARLSHVPAKLRLPRFLRDTGAPSLRAVDARDARLAASLAERNLREAKLTARGDYTSPEYTGPIYYCTLCNGYSAGTRCRVCG